VCLRGTFSVSAISPKNLPTSNTMFKSLSFSCNTAAEEKSAGNGAFHRSGNRMNLPRQARDKHKESEEEEEEEKDA
jgi:hypothetical protein